MLRAFLLICAICLGAPAAAEDNPVSPPPLGEMAAGLRQQVEEWNAMGRQIASAPQSSSYRAALVNRRDDRALRLLQGLGGLVQEVSLLSGDDPLREQTLGEMQDFLEAAADQVLQRIGEIGEEIEAQQAAVDSLSGADKIRAQARLHTLQSLRLKYYTALVDLIKSLRKLDLPQSRLTQAFLPMLRLNAEILVGQVKYTGSMLRELRVRQAAERDNADLSAAIGDLSSEQKQNLGALETLIGLLASLGEQTSEYSAVLVQQGQVLSIRILEQGALQTLLEESWASTRKSLAEDMPKIVFNLLLFLVILVLFRGLAGLARRAVRAACDRPGSKMTILLKDTLESITGGLVILLGLLIALAQVGISLGPMLAGLGVAGFILGFALQDTLGNFAAGGMILIYRPYDVDDYVEVAGVAGFVKKMSLVSTTIATFDNQTLVVPNSKIWGDVIKNVTAQKVRRVDLLFGISYGDDIEQAERILTALLAEHEKVLDKPEAKVKVHELGDSSVNFAVRPWVRTEDYWDVYWDLTREVKLRFDREGITIPFPQRAVHVSQQSR